MALFVSEVTWWDNNILLHNWAGYSETCTIGCIFWKQRCIQRASQVCMVRFLPGSFPSAKEQNTDAHKSTYHDACSKYPSPFHLFFLILMCISRHEGLWFFSNWSTIHQWVFQKSFYFGFAAHSISWKRSWPHIVRPLHNTVGGSMG